MRFHALATDYDGTIAHDGVVDSATLAALERARKSGRKLILVTGRELPDLLAVFSHIDLFDLAVMENGAVIFDPATKEVRDLTEPPPPSFTAELRARKVSPLSVGRVIVATSEPNHVEVLKVIHKLGLELQVIFNKGSVMVLPSGVNKATGLAAALTELGLSSHNAVGVGDAENDHAFLRVCECSAAVANALPAVKDTADIAMKGDHGAGVAELIDRLIANDLSDLKTLSRHRIPIGVLASPTRKQGNTITDEPGHGERKQVNAVTPRSRGGLTSTTTGESDENVELRLDPAGPGVVVTGTSGSGKSTLTTGLLERLADAGYQALVVDPEGDYTTLDFANHLGNPAQAPRPEDLATALQDTKRSIVVNLLGVPLADRPKFFAQMLPHILEEKARTGRPHWLVIDEAHHMLSAGTEVAAQAPLLPDRGILFVTVHPETVEPTVFVNVDTALVIGAKPSDTLAAFCKAIGEPRPKCPAVAGDKLATGDAMAWHRGERTAQVIHTKPPRTERKRHSRKYAEGNLGPERSFYFRGPSSKLNLRASNLLMFLQLADGVDDETWEFHRKAGEFSQWVRKQIKDEALADELAKIETNRKLPPADSRTAVRAAIESRYTLPADGASGEVT